MRLRKKGDTVQDKKGDTVVQEKHERRVSREFGRLTRYQVGDTQLRKLRLLSERQTERQNNVWVFNSCCWHSEFSKYLRGLYCTADSPCTRGCLLLKLPVLAVLRLPVLLILPVLGKIWTISIHYNTAILLALTLRDYLDAPSVLGV